MASALDKYRQPKTASAAAPSSGSPLDKYRTAAPTPTTPPPAAPAGFSMPRYTPGTSEDPAADRSPLAEMLGPIARPWEGETPIDRLRNLMTMLVPSALGRGAGSTVRSLFKGTPPAPPNPAAIRTATGAPTELLPAGTAAPTATGTSIPFNAPVTPKPALPPLAARTGTSAPTTLQAPGAMTPGRTGTSVPFNVPATPKPAPPPLAARTGTGTPSAPLPTGTGGWSMPKTPKAPPIIQAPLEQAAKVADEIAEAVGPQQAAAAIEQKVKLSVNELARAMRDRYGSQRAGDMLFGNSKAGNVIGRGARKEAIKRMAPGPSKTPQIVEEAVQQSELLRKFSDPRGAINPKLAAGIASTGIGGAVGAATGETPEERLENGLIGAGLGAVAVPLLAHAYAVGAPKAAQNALYTSVLSSPTSVFKAYLGAVGGSIGAAAEKMAAGDVRSGQRILSTLFSPGSVSAFGRALKNPQSATLSGMGEQGPNIVGRFFGAGDAVARRAMAAGGITAEEAARFTLSGAPTTPLGKEILGLWNRWFVLRLSSSLFPRVGAQILERGLERLPGVGAASVKGLNEGASTATKVARQALGAGAMAGGAALGANEDVPTWAKPYLLALSGVYALPAGVGMALGSSKPEDAATNVLSEFARNSPFPQYGPTEALKQLATGASLVPNMVRDVAVARDPYERDTRGDFFGRAKAKIPGLRETLPVRGRRVNIAGEPIADRSTPFSRVLSPAPSRNEPMKGVPDAVAQEIERLGIKINPPDFEKTVKIAGRTIAVPPEAAEAAQRERRQYVIPAVEKLLASPSYQAASDASKARRLQATIDRAEAAGAARAKARLSRLLRRKP
jgi:hypothetical protein